MRPIYRGTTPTFIVTVDGAAVSALGTVYATVRQDGVSFDAPAVSTDTAANTLSFTLTQDQTLRLKADREAGIQLRAVNSAGVAIASGQAQFMVRGIYKEGVINA